MLFCRFHLSESSPRAAGPFGAPVPVSSFLLTPQRVRPASDSPGSSRQKKGHKIELPVCVISPAAGQKEGGQALIGGLDVLVSRNFFGSQVRSVPVRGFINHCTDCSSRHAITYIVSLQLIRSLPVVSQIDSFEIPLPAHPELGNEGWCASRPPPPLHVAYLPLRHAQVPRSSQSLSHSQYGTELLRLEPFRAPAQRLNIPRPPFSPVATQRPQRGLREP